MFKSCGYENYSFFMSNLTSFPCKERDFCETYSVIVEMFHKRKFLNVFDKDMS